MNLFTDDNPKTTVTNLGFKNKHKALESIRIVEKHFDSLEKKQKIPGYTPKNVLPKRYLETVEESKRFYKVQKKYRILGLLNRAKTMIKKKNINPESVKNIKEAIKVLDKFVSTK